MNEAALRAAGLFGLPFSWGPDGSLNFGPSMTQDQCDAVTAFFAAQGPQQQYEEQRDLELAKFRADRRAMFSLIGDMGFIAVATNDTVTRDALVAFRQGVLDLPAHPPVLAATTLPALKTAMKTRYAQLTGALPTSVRNMFRELAA